MIGTEDFTWKGNKLYLRGKNTKFSVEEAALQDYPHFNKLFRVKYQDGVLSEDFYNLSRAKDHCISQASIHFNNTENGAA